MWEGAVVGLGLLWQVNGWGAGGWGLGAKGLGRKLSGASSFLGGGDGGEGRLGRGGYGDELEPGFVRGLEGVRAVQVEGWAVGRAGGVGG